MYSGCSTVIANYSLEDYQRMKRWGMDSVQFYVKWTTLRDRQDIRDRLRTQVNLAKSVGLFCFVALTGAGMPDYINYAGRQEYAGFLRGIATEFSDCGINVWHFPYHNDSRGTLEAVKEAIYRTSLPLFYQAVRQVNANPIVLTPIWQGYNDSQTLTSGRYLEVENYGWPFTTDPHVIYGFNNHEASMFTNHAQIRTNCTRRWDYNVDLVKQNLQPIINFKNKHRIQAICCESLSLYVHYKCDLDCCVRPITQDRLDWCRAVLEVHKNNDLGWMHWRYENPPTVESPIDVDGSDNGLAVLLAQYTTPTPPTPTPPRRRLTLLPVGLSLFGVAAILYLGMRGR